MAKKNNKQAKKLRHQKILAIEQREDEEREEKRQKRAKRKERVENEMDVEPFEEAPVPANKRRKIERMQPKEVAKPADEIAPVIASETMETEVTAPAVPNNKILTLGFDELKGSNSHMSKARMAAKIRSSANLRRVRSKSKSAAEAAEAQMQI